MLAVAAHTARTLGFLVEISFRPRACIGHAQCCPVQMHYSMSQRASPSDDLQVGPVCGPTGNLLLIHILRDDRLIGTGHHPDEVRGTEGRQTTKPSWSLRTPTLEAVVGHVAMAFCRRIGATGHLFAPRSWWVSRTSVWQVLAGDRQERAKARVGVSTTPGERSTRKG